MKADASDIFKPGLIDFSNSKSALVPTRALSSDAKNRLPNSKVMSVKSVEMVDVSNDDPQSDPDCAMGENHSSPARSQRSVANGAPAFYGILAQTLKTAFSDVVTRTDERNEAFLKRQEESQQKFLSALDDKFDRLLTHSNKSNQAAVASPSAHDSSFGPTPSSSSAPMFPNNPMMVPGSERDMAARFGNNGPDLMQELAMHLLAQMRAANSQANAADPPVNEQGTQNSQFQGR